MAGDWMKIELETPDKPEVHAIANLLTIDPDSVVGKLIRVWQWFDKHTTDGNAIGVSLLLVDRITGVTNFGQAMKSVGWMLCEDGMLTMPHFERHTSKSAKQRALTAKRVAEHKAKSNADGNDAIVTDALPREEKRREDKDQILLSSPPENPAVKTDPVPYEKIVALYHQHLPMCPRVKLLTATRKGYIAARWKSGAMPDLNTWEEFFKFVSQSKFLTGSVDPPPGKTRFQADLEWLTKESNFAKIAERKYHNGQG